MTRSPRRRTFATSKVPEINFSFWFLKVLTTAMGEATSDFFVHHYSPVAAVLGAGAGTAPSPTGRPS